MQKHQALEYYLTLAKRTAKNPEETKKALITLDERRRQAVKHVGPEAVQLIQKHILESVLDSDTKRVCYDHMSLDYDQYKEKITEYLTATQKTRSDKMDLGWVSQEGKQAGKGHGSWWVEDSEGSTAVEDDAPSLGMDEVSDEYLGYYGWQVKGKNGKFAKGKGKGKGKGPSEAEQGSHGQKGKGKKGGGKASYHSW